MKKIIVHIITSLKMGGAETLLGDFLEYADINFEHVVIYFHEGPHVARLQKMGIRTYHIKGLLCLYDPVFFIRLLRCVSTMRPSLLHTWLWSANVSGRIIGWLCGVPVINSFHNNVEQDGPLRNLLDRASLGLAHALVAVAPGVARSLHDTYKIQPARVTTIVNGLDGERIRNRAQELRVQRKDLGLTNDHFIIGSVGRFVSLKNYPLLIEAFAVLHEQYPQARLVLIGSGPEEKRLRDRVAHHALGQAVHFVIGQSAYGYYSLFNCFVLSSFKEGISIALLEAMSCGVPCVSTHEKKTHDVLEHEVNGLLVPSENKQALVDAIARIMREPERASQWGANGARTIKDVLSLQSMKSSYERVYTKIIEGL